MIGNMQGNLRDLAAGPEALLPKLAQEPAQGQLVVNAEDGSGNQTEETYVFEGGQLIGCKSPLGPGETMLAHAVVALTNPYGFFTFTPGPPSSAPPATTPVSALELVLEYSRAVPDVEELAHAFCPPEMVLRLGDRIDLLRGQVKILPTEWKLIFRVNNKRSVQEIATALGMERPAFARVLLTCLAIGAVYPSMSPGSSVSGVRQRSAGRSSAMRPARPASGTGPSSDSASASSSPHSAIPPVPATPSSGATPVPQSLTPMPVKRRVLAIEDSRTVQRVVQMALAELNLDIDLADSGEQGLEIAAQRRPDLVILDIMLPGMDGYKTCEALRKLLAPHKVPVIMLTSKDGALNTLRGKMAGATAYLTKPFGDEELRKAVRENLRAGG